MNTAIRVHRILAALENYQNAEQGDDWLSTLVISSVVIGTQTLRAIWSEYLLMAWLGSRIAK
jgi:hypothetical protein